MRDSNDDMMDEELDFTDFADEEWSVGNDAIELASDDARGKPYRVRRLIEEWQENRQLRSLDDLDFDLAIP